MPGSLKKASRRAAKKTAGFLRNRVIKATTENYYIKPAKIRGALTMRYSDEALQMIVRGPRLTLASYFLTPKKRPKGRRQFGLYGAVKREGGIKYIRRGFLLRDGVPFQRLSPRRRDISPIFAPAIAQIVKNLDNFDNIMNETSNKFIKNLNHEAMFELGVFKKI